MRVFVFEGKKTFLIFLAATYCHSCKNNTEVYKKVRKCETCCKEFVTPSKLKHHQKIHDENSPTNCQHCDKVYYHVDHLNKHIFECTAISYDSDDFILSFTSQQNKFELQNLTELNLKLYILNLKILKLNLKLLILTPKL